MAFHPAPAWSLTKPAISTAPRRSAGNNACANGCGVVFKLAPGSNGKWKYSVLHRFNFKDGANPAAALILDQKGNLYGTTTLGGAGGYGVVFEITP